MYAITSQTTISTRPAMAEKAPTKRATQPTKRRRGTAQVTARRRPSIGMGGSGGTGVQFSS